MPRRTQGFTLVELVVVIVVTGIMAATLTVFVRPAIDSYLVTRQRGDLLHEAESTLNTMVRELRRAVPNSVRTPGNQCFEFLPIASGGRYRAGPDTVNDSAPNCTPGANCSAWVDTSAATTQFDVLWASGTASVGDWLVINNQNTNDAYQGVNRTQVTAVSTPAAAYGVQRISIAALQVSPGYDEARFYALKDDTQAVTYTCVGADGTLDARGNGRGQLLRLSHYGFNAVYPTSCPATGSVVATQVRSCNFVYDPNQGATQQSGFVWIDIELARAGEALHLSMGAHVSNAP